MKTIIKGILKGALLLLLTVAIVAGVVWANTVANLQKCDAYIFNLAFADSTAIIGKEDIIKELHKNGIRPLGKQFALINTHEIEELLMKSECFESVDCVLLTKHSFRGDQVVDSGFLVINASQLVPVARVFEGNKSYYINRDGKSMKASAKYHSDVPVIRGKFTEDFPATKLLPLIKYVESDSALKHIVSMYNVSDSSNIFIIPNIYGHVINLGSTDSYHSKFRKLRTFYQKVMPVKGWFTYDTISLKWDYQVVATKRVKALPQVIDYTLEDEESADLATMSLDETPNTATASTDSAATQPKSPKNQHN